MSVETAASLSYSMLYSRHAKIRPIILLQEDTDVRTYERLKVWIIHLYIYIYIDLT